MLGASCLELTVPTRSLHSRGLHVEVKNRGDFPLTATVFSACFCSLFFLKDTDSFKSWLAQYQIQGTHGDDSAGPVCSGCRESPGTNTVRSTLY